MGRIKRLTELAQVEFGLSGSRKEEHTSFIIDEDDTDTSTLGSRSDSSSNEDFYMDYRTLKSKQDSSVCSKVSTNRKGPEKTVQFDVERESVTFGGPFAADEFVPQQAQSQGVQISARFNDNVHSRKQGLFKKARDRLCKCFWLCGYFYRK